MNRLSRLAHNAALAALAAALAAGCAKTDESNAATDRPASTGSAKVGDARATNSNIAVNVLLGVAQARDAVERHDKTGAMAHLDAASAALNRITTIPLVPIYSELSQSSFLAPIEAAKKQGGSSTSLKAQASAAANTAAAMSNGSDMSGPYGNSAGSAPLVAQSVTTGYSRVLLDTSVTRRQLDAARAALGRGDFEAADNNLKTIQQSVVLETAAARMPLVRARENLTLASTAASRNDWAHVKAQLNAAAKSLADYGRIAPPADMADVGVIQQQIAAYAPNVESHHDDAAARINGWWVRIANLTDKKA